jgi:nicotinate-nucleotide pyrophosphorylase
LHALRQEGERPTAAQIVAIVGGSKTTVLTHMKVILQELSTTAGVFEIPRELIQLTAEAAIAKLWTKATTMAERASEHRVQSLVTLQLALMDDLADAVAAEEAAMDRAMAAEARILVLEQELAARKSAAQQLEEMADLLKSIKRSPSGLPIDRLVSLLQVEGWHSREEVYRGMRDHGFTNSQAAQARFHALTSKYIEEEKGEDGPMFRLMEKGRAKTVHRGRAA